MYLNPVTYFIKKYHSPELKPRELKRMLNWWLPFIFNGIKIEKVSESFDAIDVRLKNTLWNRNPSKSIWGGSIFSAADPFFPIMLKQNALRSGVRTDFFTKSTEVKYLKQARTDLLYQFRLNGEDIKTAINILNQTGKYEGWYTVLGKDISGQVCFEARILSYLRVRD